MPVHGSIHRSNAKLHYSTLCAFGILGRTLTQVSCTLITTLNPVCEINAVLFKTYANTAFNTVNGITC